MPRWFSFRLLSRNTPGIIYGLPELKLDPHQRIRELVAGNGPLIFEVKNQADLKAQVIEWVSPSMFEHLVVELLQLECGNGDRWCHVGGSGDGGVDGLGFSRDGSITAVLQCKWHFNGEIQSLLGGLESIRKTWPSSQVIVAFLLGNDIDRDELPSWIRILDVNNHAEIIWRFKGQLPLAITLGLHQNC
jgi:hypothetical protein